MKREQKRRRVMAKQVRSGIIGLLENCDPKVCAWPLEIVLTITGHDERCPAHGMIMSARFAAAESDAPIAEVSRRVQRWLATAPDEIHWSQPSASAVDPQHERSDHDGDGPCAACEPEVAHGP